MVNKREIRQARAKVLLCIMLFMIAAAGGYFYYIKHKEPTQGIFVYDQGIIRKELASGYLYQPLQKDNHYQEEVNPAQGYC